MQRKGALTPRTSRHAQYAGDRTSCAVVSQSPATGDGGGLKGGEQKFTVEGESASVAKILQTCYNCAADDSVRRSARGEEIKAIADYRLGRDASGLLKYNHIIEVGSIKLTARNVADA